MESVRFVHLSDLHLQESKIQSQSVVIDALFKDIAKTHGATPIDFVIFSGDLIFSADVTADFYLFQKLVLNRISSELSVPQENIFIVPGNHDISRRDVRRFKYIETGLGQELNSTEAVNTFIKEGWTEPGRLKEPLRRMEGFASFLALLPQTYLLHDRCWVRTYQIELKGICRTVSARH
jgi:predicted MPP superfamily phosphohydrolase